MTPLSRSMVLVGVITFVVGLSGVDARATYGAHVTADEPQYLLTALSLAEDFDLDVSDEISEERFRDFHEIGLDPQTLALNDNGQELSPHDPLLPLLLAIPMGLGGWVLAKVALAGIAGITAAATVYLAVRRFHVPVPAAAVVIGAFFAAPPLVAYGTQVYPAMPAALLVVLGVISATGPSSARWSTVGLLSVVALPWLSVKYVPLAAVLAVALLWRQRIGERRRVWVFTGALVGAGIFYVVFHQQVYGGWTVYSTGDHFLDGEWQVVGAEPNYLGRSRRVVGLIVDREFGLAALAPVYLAVPALMVWWVRSRVGARWLVPALVVVSWCVATWAALTMHGWWWPGRQVVPVLPLVAVVAAAAVGRSARRIGLVVGACLLGTATWLWVALEASTGRRTLIVDFGETAWPLYRVWSSVLPDHRAMGSGDVALTFVWAVALVWSCVAVWRRTEKSQLPRALAHTEA
ncbi:MAG: hypothetical protein ACR2PK_10460 [Acidimicrobiales bacterium]